MVLMLDIDTALGCIGKVERVSRLLIVDGKEMFSAQLSGSPSRLEWRTGFFDLSMSREVEMKPVDSKELK